MSTESHAPTSEAAPEAVHTEHHDAAETHAAPEASHEHVHAEAAHADAPAAEADHFGEVKDNEMVGKVATIAVIGVGAALISAELIPGIIIGVAAAFVPNLGSKLRPFFKSAVKGAYAAARKTREMAAEASEQMQDMIAEAKADEVPPVAPPPPASV